MKLVYEGSLPVVFLPALRDLEVTRGEPVEIPDEVAVSLLEQSTWSEAPPEQPTDADAPARAKRPGKPAETETPE